MGKGQQQPDEYMDTSEVAELLGIGARTVTNYAYRGDMPKPDRYYGKAPAWRRSTITEWLANRPGQGVGGGRPRRNPS